jgi:putative membrane protein
MQDLLRRLTYVTKTAATIALAIPLAAIAACSDDSNNNGGVFTPDGGAGDGANATEARLDDAQIGGVTSAVNTGEIQQGRLAASRATTNEAREFGAMMVTMHTAAQERQAALLSRLGLTPRESALSQQLTATAQSTLAELETKSGRDFDVAYLDAQIAQHRTTLQVIDTVLLPSVAADELRRELETARAEVADHLQMAEVRRQTVGAVTPDGGADDDAGTVGGGS